MREMFFFYMLHSKQPLVCRKFSGMIFLSKTSTYLMRFFAGKTEGAECTNCLKSFIGAHVRMTHQPQVCGQHHITIFIKLNKEHKISCRNQKDVGMGG